MRYNGINKSRLNIKSNTNIGITLSKEDKFIEIIQRSIGTGDVDKVDSVTQIDRMGLGTSK